MNKTFKTIATLLLLIFCSADMAAQSGIYVCGHFRRNRASAVTKVKNSGYTNAILFNVDVQADGTLTTDYDWTNKKANEAGGIICQNGEYVFAQYQPNYAKDVKSLLTAPTSVRRIEICIGGWGNGSYGNIKSLIDSEGTGENSTLYKNFRALKEAIPEIVAVNNDQEQDYDANAAYKFHRMMYDLGYKTTIAPYTNKSFWQNLVKRLNSYKKDAVDLIYLQTYGGGAGNDPADWDFGGVTMWVGFDCESNGNLSEMESKFNTWHDAGKVKGGFLWNYNSEARTLNEWATAINRIFYTREDTSKPVVAKAYSDADFGGYCVELAEGKYCMADLAVLGLKERDLSSLEVTDGYKVTLYKSTACRSTGKVFTESINYVGDAWNDATRSLTVESATDGVDAITDRTDANDAMPAYNLAGQRVDGTYHGIIIKNGRKTFVNKQ